MVFALLIIVFILAIAFFHYIQGFFSAALSAIFAVFAAVLAFSYHETIVEKLLGGMFPDYIEPAVLLVLFMVIYLVLRSTFDSLVPGNVRVPVAVDKAGAAISGLVAGIFATGVLAVAAQELPFGPDIAGYTRYEVQDVKNVKVPTESRALAGQVWDEVKADKPGQFGSASHGVPIIPVDNILVNTVSYLSNPGGSLQSGKPLSSVHPDYLDELFGQRLGVEPGATHVSGNVPEKHIQTAKVVGLYRLDPNVTEADYELADIRKGNGTPLKAVRPGGGQMFLVIRVMVGHEAADSDGLFRFSPGTARLFVDDGSPGSPKDLYPVGTLDKGKKLLISKIDDFMFLDVKSQDRGVDLVYEVDQKSFEKQAPRNTFVEIKRLARVDLSGMAVNPDLKAAPEIELFLNPLIAHPERNPETILGLGGGQAAPQEQSNQPQSQQPSQGGGQPSSAAGFNFGEATASANLPVPIAVPKSQQNGNPAAVSGGNVTADKDGKLVGANLLDADPAQLAKGDVLGQFLLPAGQAMVQVSGTSGSSSPWLPLSEPEQYELVDSQSKHYQPYGIFAAYKDSRGAEQVRMLFINATTIAGQQPPQNTKAPSRIILYYIVPANTTLTEFDDHGQKAHALSLMAK